MNILKSAQVFVEIVNQGNLSLAAERLDISRAMVSRHLEELEKYLDIRLLQRTTRRISLTHAGEQAFIQCNNLLQAQLELQNIAGHGQQNLNGLLRITVSPSLMQGRLANDLAKFCQQHPQVKLEIIVTEETVDLISQQIDVAIRISNDVASGLIARPLGHCHSVLCASPDYLQQAGVPQQPDDLIKHRCLAHKHAGRTGWNLKVDKHYQRVPILAPISCTEAVALVQLCLQHAGIAMLPTDLVQPYLMSGQLITVLMDYPVQSFHVQAVYASRHHMPLLTRTFIDYLQYCHNPSV